MDASEVLSLRELASCAGPGDGSSALSQVHIHQMRSHPLAITIVFAPAILGLIAGAWLQQPLVPLLGVIASALAAWQASGGGRAGWRELGLGTPIRWGRVVKLGAAGALAVYAIVAIVVPFAARYFGRPDLSAFAGIEGRIDLLIFMLVVALVNGAFAEEILFRGFLQNRLEQYLAPHGRGVWIALAVTSVLFGLAHMYQGWSGVIGTGLAGLVFGIVRLRDGGRLWGAVAAHAFYDWSAMIIVYFVGVRGP
jgi:uncharacterized protein